MFSLLLASFLFILLVNHRYYWRVPGHLRFKDITPFFISHRGYKKRYPENSIDAYNHAEEIGFQWIELDVVSTIDGYVMCSHNFDLEKETNAYGYISSITKNDVNAYITLVNKKETHISKLPQLLDVFKNIGSSTKVNIEIKSPRAHDLSTARAVSKIIKSLPQDRIIISSFNPFVILYFKIFHRTVITGFLYQNIEYYWFVNWIHPSYIHPRIDLIDDEVMLHAKNKNLGINTWTVNNTEAIEWCRKNKIDGIITDLGVVK